MTERISQKDFKEIYKSDLGRLQSKLALEPPKVRMEPSDTSETTRKKYEYGEFNLQCQVVAYLNLKYPFVLFESSPINLNLTKAQRMMMSAIQKKGFHPPDIKLYIARRNYIGFALELKKSSPYLKDSVTLQKNKHLANQQRSIELMREQGWLSGFYWEFGVIKTAIDWYLEKT